MRRVSSLRKVEKVGKSGDSEGSGQGNREELMCNHL